jgi:uncharacterized membrane protein
MSLRDPETGNGDTTRLETFSDGVFAIAITLLVLEIRVPHVEESESLLVALLGLWPSYVGYAVSFLQIGVIWANHHNRFRLLERSDHVLLFLNILFLMCVAFIPFPTALLAEYIQGSEGERQTAIAVYSGTLAVTGIFFTLLWLYAANNYRLVNRALDPRLLQVMTRRYLIGAALYIVAFAIAFVSALASLVLIVGLALLFVLPEPGERPPPGSRTEAIGDTDDQGVPSTENSGQG